MTSSLYLVVVEGLDDTQDVPVVGFEVGLNLCQAPGYKLNQEQPTRLHIGQSEQSIVEFQISIWKYDLQYYKGCTGNWFCKAGYRIYIRLISLPRLSE